MSLRLPVRRLRQPAVLAFQASAVRTLHTTRPARGWWSRKSMFGQAIEPDPETAATKPTDDRPTRQRLLERLTKENTQGESIFLEEMEAADKKSTQVSVTDEADGRQGLRKKGEQKREQLEKLDNGAYTVDGSSLIKEHMARAIDPDPRSRVRWERRAVMKRVAIGTNPFSREPRAVRIARTERQILSRSHWLPTSVKKLQPLASQVAGKSVAEAMLQMRFSKKKMAAEVRVQLGLARDAAVVERGMGLGLVNGEVFPAGQEVEVKTKSGKFVKIDDPTRLYVAQAWVNRGPLRGRKPIYHARGRTAEMRKPATSECLSVHIERPLLGANLLTVYVGISLLLKEEKTRIREHEEREARRRQKAPWVHLPDRPVTAQRPYYCW